MTSVPPIFFRTEATRALRKSKIFIFKHKKSSAKYSTALVAGLLGFEPRIHGIKTRCLTAWLQPNKNISGGRRI